MATETELARQHPHTAPGGSFIADRVRQFRKLMRLLPSQGFRRGLRYGVAAAVEHLSVVRGIKLSTLIDVGANRGQFSLLVRTLHPGAKIYAFEPLSKPAAQFTSVFRGDTRTVLHQCAIGDQSTTSATMFVSHEDDSSSLLPATEEQIRFAAGAKAVGVEQVKVRRLDEILSVADIVRPALLKLDVQGYELAALRSCGPVLQAVDFVYVEVSFVTLYAGQALADEIVQFLFAEGFSFAAVNNPVFDRSGHCLQADFLFGRRSGPADAASSRSDVR